MSRGSSRGSSSTAIRNRWPAMRYSSRSTCASSGLPSDIGLGGPTSMRPSFTARLHSSTTVKDSPSNPTTAWHVANQTRSSPAHPRHARSPDYLIRTIALVSVAPPHASEAGLSWDPGARTRSARSCSSRRIVTRVDIEAQGADDNSFSVGVWPPCPGMTTSAALTVRPSRSPNRSRPCGEQGVRSARRRSRARRGRLLRRVAVRWVTSIDEAAPRAAD